MIVTVKPVGMSMNSLILVGIIFIIVLLTINMKLGKR